MVEASVCKTDLSGFESRRYLQNSERGIRFLFSSVLSRLHGGPMNPKPVVAVVLSGALAAPFIIREAADIPPHVDNPPYEEIQVPTITYALDTHSGTVGQILLAIDENQNFR